MHLARHIHWYFPKYHVILLLLFFPSATLEKMPHETDKVQQRTRAGPLVSGIAGFLRLITHMEKLAHQPMHFRQMSDLRGGQDLENGWNLEVILTCNSTTELLILGSKQTPHYLHQSLFPFIKEATFVVNKKAIISQLEYSLVYS